MATTPLGGRLPNVNRKGPSPCVGGGGGSSSSSNNQRKQERAGGRDHHRHHQSQSREKTGHRHQQTQQRGDQKASTVAAHAGELDPAATNATNNFEYDDNEWDIGIGDLIIDLDADIEKTRDEKLSSGTGMASTPASAVATTNHQIQNASGLNSSSNGTSLVEVPLESTSGNHSSIGSCASGKHPIGSVNNNNSSSSSNTSSNAAGNPGKMAVEHSATVDKGLKMKIKRTKPGTKTSEAKHEIVKSNEINGGTITVQDGNVSSNSNSSSSSSSSSTSSTTSSTSNNSSTAQNLNSTDVNQSQSSSLSSGKNKPSHPASSTTATGNNTSTSKRGSSGHRRDKTRDKHEKPTNNHATQQSKPEMNGTTRSPQNHTSSISSCVTTSISATSTSTITTCSSVTSTTSSSSLASSCAPSSTVTSILSSNTTNATSCSLSPNSSTSSSAIAAVAGSANNQAQGPTLAATAPQQQQPQGLPPSSRTGGFPANQGPGATANSAAAPCPPASPASATAAAGSAAKPEQTKVAAVPGPHIACTLAEDSMDASASPPPAKKLKICPKSEPKDMSDVCVGTSVGTITEPECLGPCEPGTSVTLEGIVWHETEGGVLVVNVTWRGKTYVGTLLDCTRHDWAPPRFCDSPTSDLDARTPKGRGKRGRAAANATPGNDLSNFTETRSSVHSKLRNGGGKGRRGAQGSPAAASPSPASTASVTTAATTSSFVPPRPDPAAKRKSRGPEEDEKSKRRAAPPPTPPSGSPPASPILLECPEPNCSKKYKHINGLKYHQSHAHGSADDEDTKDAITSMSENDESNIEAPSPATPVKSPSEKLEAGTPPVRVASPTNSAMPPETPPPPPRVPSPNAETPPTTTTTTNTTTVLADKSSIVKPGVLRFGQDEQVQANPQPPPPLPPPRQTVQQPSPPQPLNPNPPSPNSRPSQSPRPVPSLHPSTGIPQPLNIPQPPQSTQLPIQSTIVPAQQCLSNPQPHLQSPQQSLAPVPHQLQSVSHPVQTPLTQNNQLHASQQQPPLPPLQSHQQPQQTNLLTAQHPGLQSLTNQIPSGQPSLQPVTTSGAVQSQHLQSYPNVTLHAKIPQFKVKPTAALMPEQDKSKDLRASKPQGYKKKSRKSPGGSPHPSPLEAPLIDSAREDVQSPAYSDISDDAAPVLESENVDNKGLKQVQEKDSKPSSQSHLPTQFSMYPYYGQSQYLVPSVQEKPGGQDQAKMSGGDLVPKQEVKPLNVPQMPSINSLQGIASTDKEKSKDLTLAQPHYYASYGAYMPPGYPYQQQQHQVQVQEPDSHDQKVCKIKQEPQQQTSLKEKQHENHQILKESIEMKSQMNPYHVYHGTQSQRAPPTSSAQIQDDRRYYLYPGEQRRKDECGGKQSQQSKPPAPSPKHQTKQEKPQEMGGKSSSSSEEAKIKQEGVKPTMETQGPPPPPTSQYAYIHPGYMPPQHYGALSFDPGHPVYRGLSPMLVPGPYTGNPYLHQLPRYHGAAEDLSRPPAGKALDLLQHHANQYYSAHKIHELQERALKSPTPKGPSASASPSSVGCPNPARPPSGPPTCVAGPGPPQSQQSLGKQQSTGQALGQQQPCQPQQAPGEAPGAGGNLGKDSRTTSSSPPPPPPPRLVHHTHLDIGYSILNGQYPAPYGGKPLVRP